MEQKRPERKKYRLENYPYDTCGAYFLTICTAERRKLFWDMSAAQADTVGATIGRPQDIALSPYGQTVDEAIHKIPEIYPAVWVDQYVIMPDHVHLLLLIRADENGRPMVAPTISRVVQQMKGHVTKRIGHPVWQKLFFDHVIRNRQDYEEHAKYIAENPLHWQDDPADGP